MKRTKDCGITNLVQKVRRDQSIERISQAGYLKKKEKVVYYVGDTYMGKYHE